MLSKAKTHLKQNIKLLGLYYDINDVSGDWRKIELSIMKSAFFAHMHFPTSGLFNGTWRIFTTTIIFIWS